MMRRSEENNSEELHYSPAPTHSFTVDDFVKMMNLRSPSIEGQNDSTYREFVQQVAQKVREL